MSAQTGDWSGARPAIERRCGARPQNEPCPEVRSNSAHPCLFHPRAGSTQQSCTRIGAGPGVGTQRGSFCCRPNRLPESGALSHRSGTQIGHLHNRGGQTAPAPRAQRDDANHSTLAARKWSSDASSAWLENPPSPPLRPVLAYGRGTAPLLKSSHRVASGVAGYFRNIA